MDLERELIALAPEIAVPVAPDLVPGVMRALERPPENRIRRRWVLAVALAILAALTATLALPDARSALLRILQLGGERIELVEPGKLSHLDRQDHLMDRRGPKLKPRHRGCAPL